MKDMAAMSKLPSILPALLLLFVKALVGTVSIYKYQSIMYLACAWHLSIFNAHLIDEPFIRFEGGPKLQSIQEYLETSKPVFENLQEPNRSRIINAIRRELTESQYLIVVDAILGYGEKSDEELKEILDSDQSWQKEDPEGKFPLPIGAVISREAILRTYAKKT